VYRGGILMLLHTGSDWKYHTLIPRTFHFLLKSLLCNSVHYVYFEALCSSFTVAPEIPEVPAAGQCSYSGHRHLLLQASNRIAASVILCLQFISESSHYEGQLHSRVRSSFAPVS
jgi:hypothetical protein